MTNSEAIAELKDIFINVLECRDTRTQIAFDMAIDALEKQMPKKPIINWNDFKGLPDYFCPVCHSVVADFIGRNFVKEHHCICGQAIDWSEE